ncbi:MAG TPA: AraC family transcriptional regulator [Aliicoccus persicus]|uniref:AraC family transcriptional regulator n=1 Tax=Aliicoccus persicus TaxID=930138 RepID=A0A921JCM0_9STAP|nr:AraC family transcriptional regulator [Aliicoccus persicus]
MDIKLMNAAIDYVEDHLSSPIDLGEIERISAMSRYNFQKVFTILSGVTFGEYVRMRRMSRAMQLLKETETKILDIALECGYESQDAFTKSFKNLYKITPNSFRRHPVSLTTFPKMNISVTIRGGISMAYQVRELETMSVVGEVRLYKSMGEALRQINSFWNEFNDSERPDALIEIADKKIQGFLGVSIPQGDGLEYMIAVSSDADTRNFESREIPGGRYLVFEAKGPVPDEIQRVTKEAFESVIPSSDYELRDAPEFELYKPGDPNSAEYVTEIWVPVQ